MAAASDELRIASLPRRLEYAEPGSIALPRFVFDWLQNPEAGSLDLPKLGARVGLFFSFENQKPILYGAVFEERDGELVLVCSEPLTGSGSCTRSIPTTAGTTSGRAGA